MHGHLYVLQLLSDAASVVSEVVSNRTFGEGSDAAWSSRQKRYTPTPQQLYHNSNVFGNNIFYIIV